MSRAISIDLIAGEVRIAGVVVTGVSDASAVAVGAVRLGDGTVIRPLAFGDRAQLCAAHIERDALAAAVLVAASRTPASNPTVAGGERAAAEALALHLAGADAVGGALSFADVAVAVRHVFGWSAQMLLSSPAHVVDRLAATALSTTRIERDAPGDGWTRFVLSADDQNSDHSSISEAGSTPPATATDAVREFRDRLAGDLLERGWAALSAEAAALIVAPPRNAQHAAEEARWPASGELDPSRIIAATVERSEFPNSVALGPSTSDPLVASAVGAPVHEATDRVVDAAGPADGQNGSRRIDRARGPSDRHEVVAGLWRRVEHSTGGDEPVDGVVGQPPDRGAQPSLVTRLDGDEWGGSQVVGAATPAPARRPQFQHRADAADATALSAPSTAMRAGTLGHGVAGGGYRGIAATYRPALADQLAAALDDEADVRGLWRW